PNPAQLIQGGWGRKRSTDALPFGAKITITLAPSRAGTPVGAILTLLNEKGEVIMGVAGGGPGEAPRGGAPAPSGAGVPRGKPGGFAQAFFFMAAFYCRLLFLHRADNVESPPPIQRMRKSRSISMTFQASGLETEVLEDTVAVAHAATVGIAASETT